MVILKIDANLVLEGPEPHQTKYFIAQEIPPSVTLVQPTPRQLPSENTGYPINYNTELNNFYKLG